MCATSATWATAPHATGTSAATCSVTSPTARTDRSSRIPSVPPTSSSASRRHHGGEIVLYCAEPQGESVEVQTPFCSADWVGDDVLLAVWVTVDPDDLALVQGWLVESLDTIVDGVLATGGDLELD